MNQRPSGDKQYILVVSRLSSSLSPLTMGSTNNNDPEAGPPKKETFMEAATSKALRPFVIISSSYLLFTITDGAIRMIVLVHAYQKLFSAMEVSLMFTMYELAGVFTNLVCCSK